MRHTPEKDAARQLRSTQTDAERKLWNALRDRQVLNLKFRRQHPIGNYIADFCCIEKGLIVELDGSQHLERVKQDEERTKWLNEHGFQVLRFWNEDTLFGVEGVVEKIRNHIFQMTLTRPATRADLSLRERK
jgi:very-short-patch-repair endonuclease